MAKPRKPQPGRTPLTRRHFMQATAAVGSQALMLSSTDAVAAGTNLEGYTNAPSVVAGGTLDFFLRDPQAISGTTVYPFSVTRIGAPDVGMLATTVAIGNQVVPADASTNGCRWTRSLQLAVPASWPSGLYFAFVGSGANACTVPFVVRPASPTAGVKTLVQITVTTVQAYNEYGGKSLYDYNSTGGIRATRVSLDRPLTQSFNAFFDVWSQYLVRWMAKNGLAADFCTDIDIVANPALLNPYQLYVQAGHDEYWPLARRNTMDAFVARGGNAAYLGGNTSWFQARLEPNAAGTPNRTLVCYKSVTADPIADPALKTDVFATLTPPNPENSTVALGFTEGCSWANAALPRPNTPSIVARPEHWAFAGTGLTQGAGFGGAYVGYESNAALFVPGTDGRPYATGTDGTPATTRILANADATTWNAQSIALGGSGEKSGYAMVAVFSRGGAAGTVFAAGSTDWAYGLRPELDGQTPTPISRITLNVVNKLSSRWSESADVRQFRRTVGGFSVMYYSTDTSLPPLGAIVIDGWVFRAFTAAVSGSAPVVRYRSASAGTLGTRYRYSLSGTLASSDPSWVLEGTAFHAFAAAGTGTTPVYEHVIANAAPGETLYLYSTSATPPAGWSAGGVVFHAPGEGTNAAPVVPGFTLSVSGSAVSAQQGRSATSGITIVPTNGFTGTVSFSASGLPAGTTATFTPASSTIGSTLTLAAGTTSPVGSYPITVTATSPATGTSPALTVTAIVTLSITSAATPTFTLSPPVVNPVTVFRGQSVTTEMIKVNPLNGFGQSVSFSATGVPSGVSATFQPLSSTGGTKMVFTTTSTSPLGTFPITVRGTSAATTTLPSISATTSFTLVIAAPPPSFALTASPTSLTMFAGGIFGASTKVTVVKLNGFAGTVTFSVTGMPSGMNYSFSSQSSDGGTTLRMSARYYGAVPFGTYTLTIVGVSGSLRATTTVRVSVTF